MLANPLKKESKTCPDAAKRTTGCGCLAGSATLYFGEHAVTPTAKQLRIRPTMAGSLGLIFEPVTSGMVRY